MAHAAPCPPILRLKRSAQSGQKAMAAVYTVVYTESCSMAYIFGGAEIDLTNMQVGDAIDIRVRKQIIAAGGWVVHDISCYTDAQPARHVTAHISAIPDTYGVEISVIQSAGALRTLDCEFYTAKRIGLT